MRKKVILLTVVAITVLTAGLTIMRESAALARADEAERKETDSGAEGAAGLPDNTVIMYIGSSKAFINGDETQIIEGEPEVTPYLRDGSAFIPLRFAAASFGVKTDWNPGTRTAVIDAEDVRLTVIEGGRMLTRVLERPGIEPLHTEIEMSAAAEMNGGRLCVPARYVAEALGKEVFYDRGLIIISKDAGSLNAEKDKDYIEELVSSFTGLERVGSKERLIELLGLEEERTDFGVYGEVDDMAEGGVAAIERDMAPMPQTEAAQAPAATSGMAVNGAKEAQVEQTADFSQTNTQVAGVDEADIIKTDGEYIYYARSGNIEIVRAENDGGLELMSEIIVEDSFSFNEIFIDKDRIIAIGTYYPRYEAVPFSGAEMSRSYFYPGMTKESAKAVVYDVSDKREPKEERSVELNGRYLTARKTGNSVYFISSNYIYFGNLDQIAPAYRDSAIGTEEVIIGYDEVYHFPVTSGNNIITIAGFNINEPSKPVNTETFLGAGENIYMSAANLYIAGSDLRGADGSNKTEIYKFAISNGDIVYSNKGSVPGSLLNQFSMDEHRGYFRAGTTVYNYGTGRGGQQYNCLYVLDGSMEIIGKIEDIAPDERIYSVRFMGDRAYMVTFKQVDPLFAIDLANPEKPEIMGALKIPGYSDYLHPYDENHLIGFGKDTTVDRYGNAYYLGMKMSLFDITDITSPKEKFVEYIGDRGTDSPLLQNHKALLFNKDKGLLAFPVNLYEVKDGNGGGELQYGEFVNSYAYVYDIDLLKGFTLRGRISHMNDEDLLKASAWAGSYNKLIERLLYIENRLYTASNSMIKCNRLDTLDEMSAVEFK